MSKTLRDAYGNKMHEMLKFSKAPDKIDETNVYQESNPDLTPYMEMLLKDNLLPGSGLKNPENFKKFYEQVVNEGKRGLILMEHYTNLDLPEIIYLLKVHGEDWSADFSKRIVAVAGMKLNESTPLVKVWAEGFTRVVIYPTRSLDKFESNNNISQEEIAEEEALAKKINFAAMRAMDNCKRRGQVVLVFPSGTRYRPGHPDTKKGLKEIDSYLRLFDTVLLVSVNGQILRINMETPDDMLSDHIAQDKITLTAHEPIECASFRKEVLASLPENEEDPKQRIIDKVMGILEEMHNKNE